MAKPCECEHERHSNSKGALPDSRRKLDLTHPNHEYMANFLDSEIKAVGTIYGVYHLCKECEACFPDSFRKEEK